MRINVGQVSRLARQMGLSLAATHAVLRAIGVLPPKKAKPQRKPASGRKESRR